MEEAPVGEARRSQQALSGRGQRTLPSAKLGLRTRSEILPGTKRSVSTHMGFLDQQGLTGPRGSLDGDGAGDHDQPYRFGWRPRASVPFPFNTREYARLLVFRSRLEKDLGDDRADDGANWPQAAA
jgi:hypothetical protein